MSTVPGFSQIHFKRFCRFINQGLAEELEKFPTIKDPDHEIAFQLFVKGYQLLELLIKERNDVYESLTYSSELYVSARLIFLTSKVSSSFHNHCISKKLSLETPYHNA